VPASCDNAAEMRHREIMSPTEQDAEARMSIVRSARIGKTRQASFQGFKARNETVVHRRIHELCHALEP
jgi:hypothetical protein